MVVRTDKNLELIGKVADVPYDLSPLELGLEGKYKGKVFALVGRLKVAWSDGIWNEWYCYFEDGRTGWLAEAQGFFAMSFATELTNGYPTQNQLKVGKWYTFAFAGKDYSFAVNDIRECEVVASEGEMPFKGMQGRKTVNVDLMAAGKSDFGNIEFVVGEKDIPTCYLGEYVTLPELTFNRYRELDGWRYR